MQLVYSQPQSPPIEPDAKCKTLLLIILSLICKSGIICFYMSIVYYLISCSKRMSVNRNTLGRWINVETVSQALTISDTINVDIRCKTASVRREQATLDHTFQKLSVRHIETNYLELHFCTLDPNQWPSGENTHSTSKF